MDGIAGKVAVITGGASGLGAGLAQAFVDAGVRVVLADVLADAGTALAQALGENCLFQRTDLRIDEDLDAVLQKAVHRFGGVDFLINVACSYADKGMQTDRSGWHQGFDVNLIGHAVLIQKSVPYLKESAGASIVNLTSASGKVAQARRWVYPATKAAIEQLTRSAALDLAEFGIRVNSLLPGRIAKDERDITAAPGQETTHASRLHMIPRLESMREVAEAALFLCSRHARFMTGSCLTVDGGYTALGPQGREVHVPTRPG